MKEETRGRPRKYDLVEEALAFREWADRATSIVLRAFVVERGYCHQLKLGEYGKMCTEFQEAYDYARLRIGIRREEKALEGKGSPCAFNRYAAMYDPELKSHEAELKKIEQDNMQYYIVPKKPYDD